MKIGGVTGKWGLEDPAAIDDDPVSALKVGDGSWRSAFHLFQILHRHTPLLSDNNDCYTVLLFPQVANFDMVEVVQSNMSFL